MRISKRHAIFFVSFLSLAGGIWALADALPSSAPAEAIATARAAQSLWMEQRTRDIVAQRGWNGVPRPPDAPGTPVDLTMLAGGAAGLLAALGFGVLAARRRFP